MACNSYRLYAYVGGNPTTLTDPLGLLCFKSNDALSPGFFVPGAFSPDPGAVQSTLGPESLPLLMGLGPAFAAEGGANIVFQTGHYAEDLIAQGITLATRKQL